MDYSAARRANANWKSCAIAAWAVLACWARSVSSLPPALLLALPLARWSMALVLHVFPPARPTGLGAAYHHAITTRRMLITGLVALTIALIFGHFTGLIAWMIGTIAALLIGLYITKNIGGVTGDSCGAIDEI